MAGLKTDAEEQIAVYRDVEVSPVTGETESYDTLVFPTVVRRREIELIKETLVVKKPSLVLDFGCGGGWLSLLMSNWGFCVVGVDISRNMTTNAKHACHEAEFVVCDATLLPFRREVFDGVVGISILHHINLQPALAELKRLMSDQSMFLFMEPNALNPFSAIGRRLFPMEAHTEGERQFTSEYLQTALNLADFSVEDFHTLFLVAFPLARLFKTVRLRSAQSIAQAISLFESFVERIPGLRRLNSNIVLVGIVR